MSLVQIRPPIVQRQQHKDVQHNKYASTYVRRVIFVQGLGNGYISFICKGMTHLPKYIKKSLWDEDHPNPNVETLRLVVALYDGHKYFWKHGCCVATLRGGDIPCVGLRP
jgi:hypothetical protein